MFDQVKLKVRHEEIGCKACLLIQNREVAPWHLMQTSNSSYFILISRNVLSLSGSSCLLRRERAGPSPVLN